MKHFLLSIKQAHTNLESASVSQFVVRVFKCLRNNLLHNLFPPFESFNFTMEWERAQMSWLFSGRKFAM